MTPLGSMKFNFCDGRLNRWGLARKHGRTHGQVLRGATVQGIESLRSMRGITQLGGGGANTGILYSAWWGGGGKKESEVGATALTSEEKNGPARGRGQKRGQQAYSD